MLFWLVLFVIIYVFTASKGGMKLIVGGLVFLVLGILFSWFKGRTVPGIRFWIGMPIYLIVLGYGIYKLLNWAEKQDDDHWIKK